MAWLRVFILVLGVLLGWGAAAQPDLSPEQKAKVAELKKKAEGYYQSNKTPKALEALQEAYLISKDPDLLYGIGRCYSELGRWTEAAQHFSLYLELSPTNALREDAREELSKAEAQRAKSSAAFLSAVEEKRQLLLEQKKGARTFLLGAAGGALVAASLSVVGLRLAKVSTESLDNNEFEASAKARSAAVSVGLCVDVISLASLASALYGGSLYRKIEKQEAALPPSSKSPGGE